MTIIPVSGGAFAAYDVVVGRGLLAQAGAHIAPLAKGRTVIVTDETVAANVEAAKENASRLSLLTSTVPLIAGILGLIALAAGLVMVARNRSDSPKVEATYVSLDKMTETRRRR